MATAAVEAAIEILLSGKTTEDREPACATICDLVVKGGPKVFVEVDLVEKLKVLFGNNKKPGAREGGCMVIKMIAEKAFTTCEAYLQEIMPLILDMCGDKMKFVGAMAAEAAKVIVEHADPYAAFKTVPVLLSKMGNEDKWQTHVAALKSLGYLMLSSGDQVGTLMPLIVPKVAAMMWEMKQEVKDAAVACLEEVCGCIDNRDVEPFIPALISCIQHPDEVPECVHLLAATTFVQTVKCAELSIVEPLLVRAFSEKATSIIRLAAVIVENMSKLVDEPSDAEAFLNKIFNEVKIAADTQSNPECRGVCVRARDNLQTLQYKIQSEPRKILSSESEKAKVDEAVGKVDPAGAVAVSYATAVAVGMANARMFEEDKWTGIFKLVLGPWVGEAKAAEAAIALKSGLESAVEPEEEIDLDDDVEDLCNVTFSLAYGSKILLNNTQMRLKRGFKYGLMGPNQCGKSTLLRAIAAEQVEGFPPPDEVRTIFMETDIHADDADYSVLEYIKLDKRLDGISEVEMRKVLESVGFVQDMSKYTGEGAHQAQPVGTLSGGWRMKVALSRAMLMRADIMLLDEPTNHLDVSNVAWVKEYLRSLKDVTCIMVSHDTGLLNEVCTHIIDMEGNLKLRLFKGNLTAFAEVKPSVAQYFTITETKVKMEFPKPGALEGINSKGKPIMKMAGCTFTYPRNRTENGGNGAPTLFDITVRVSLSSRVACVGKNGAGKSTMIKLLTGELEPQTGVVWKHPNARVGYIAQHAFHHIEQHMDKTPCEYILWRFATGEDKEALAKDTMQLTEEDLKKMKVPIEWKWTDEESGKTMKEKRVIDRLAGGRKVLKNKTFEYEVKWEGKPMGQNSFVGYDTLKLMGYEKLMKEVDEKIASRLNSFNKPLTASNVEKHMAGIGMEPEYSSHTRIRALSGGQKVKVVLGATLWNCPHILILDEPTNYLDRDALGAMMAAIETFDGGVVMITHNNDFCSALCPETWVLQLGHLDCKGDPEWMKALANEKVEVIQADTVLDAFGNTVKVAKSAKKLSRKEAKQKARLKALRLKRGDAVSESSDEDDM